MLERRVDVAFPQIRRLDDVDVAVEHAKSGVRHDVALLSIPAMLDRMWRQPRVLCPRAAWSAAIVFRESCATTRVCLATARYVHCPAAVSLLNSVSLSPTSE